MCLLKITRGVVSKLGHARSPGSESQSSLSAHHMGTSPPRKVVLVLNISRDRTQFGGRKYKIFRDLELS